MRVFWLIYHAFSIHIFCLSSLLFISKYIFHFPLFRPFIALSALPIFLISFVLSYWLVFCLRFFFLSGWFTYFVHIPLSCLLFLVLTFVSDFSIHFLFFSKLLLFFWLAFFFSLWQVMFPGSIYFHFPEGSLPFQLLVWLTYQRYICSCRRIPSIFSFPFCQYIYQYSDRYGSDKRVSIPGNCRVSLMAIAGCHPASYRFCVGKAVGAWS